MSEVLWTPNVDAVGDTAMQRFLDRISGEVPGVRTYGDLHEWSVNEPLDFWRAMLAESGMQTSGSVEPVREGDTMPGVRHFPKLRLSFTENMLRYAQLQPEATALISVSESRETRRVTFAQLRRRVASCAARLRALGIVAGDRVAGYMPNIDEAVVAMLATSSLGAIWSSCSPDFGVQGVLDRFGQIEPRVLFTANGYRYNGKAFGRLDELRQIAESITSIEHVVVVPYLEDAPIHLDDVPPQLWRWEDFADANPDAELVVPHFPFDQPLYVMYSSGTTGVPKCIVHGAGGTLLQHAKELVLHSDLREGDTIMYFTTCGWMMWNWLVSSLFVGASVVLFDGAPTYPGLDRLWRLVEDEGITHFGTSPRFIGACRDKLRPKDFDLSTLRVLMSTGAPLLPEDFDWVYENVKTDVQLASISGGTDIISCFMLGNPVLPVYRGEIQALGLGMDVAAYDEAGEAVFGEKGELVCRTPFPSAPIYFWNDPEGERYRGAYFSRGDGTWFHGDFIAITESQGSCGGIVVYGRSDATLNPGGVRIGTAEIYRLVETRAEIEDSIVVGRPFEGDVRVELYVKLAAGVSWSEELGSELKKLIRAGASPRHVPGLIAAVPAIPYTISGKKVELAVRQIVCGEEPQNLAALANPEALEAFRAFV